MQMIAQHLQTFIDDRLYYISLSIPLRFAVAHIWNYSSFYDIAAFLFSFEAKANEILLDNGFSVTVTSNLV